MSLTSEIGQVDSGDIFDLTDKNIKMRRKLTDCSSVDKLLLSIPATQPRGLTKRPPNVINSILNRELGRPVTIQPSARASVKDSQNERLIELQLVSRRCQSVSRLEDENGTNDTQSTVVMLEDNRESRVERGPTVPYTGWTKFKFTKSTFLFELCMAEEDTIVLQSKCTTSTPTFNDTIYSLDANGFQFHSLCTLLSSKVLDWTKLLNGSSQLINNESRHPILLLSYQMDFMRAFDCVTKKVIAEMTLKLMIGNTQLVRYKLLFVSNDKIYLQGTDDNDNARVILILKYPPFWTTLGIIHVHGLRFQLRMLEDCYCKMQLDRETVVSTWESFMDKVEPYTPRRNLTPASLSINFRGRIKEMPIAVKKTPLSATVLGVITLEIPLVYAVTDNGAQVYPTGPETGSQTVLCFYNDIDSDDYQFSLVKQLPDSSSRLLVSDLSSAAYHVVNFKYDDVENERVLLSYTTRPFAIGDETSIRDMAWNKRLGLFAILTVNQRQFQVVLYKASGLSEFKRFPKVLASEKETLLEQEEEEGDNMLRDYKILSFTTRCIIVSSKYKKHHWTLISIYGYPLMSELNSL